MLDEKQRSLCESNYRLIYSFLNSKCRGAYNFEECEFHAINGFMKAVLTFDYCKGGFSTYAYRCMFNEVACFIRKERTKNKYEVPDADCLQPEKIENKTVLDEIVEAFDDKEKNKILKEVRRVIENYEAPGDRKKKFDNLLERYDLNINVTQFAKLKGMKQPNLCQLERRALDVLRNDTRLCQLFECYKKCSR